MKYWSTKFLNSDVEPNVTYLFNENQLSSTTPLKVTACAQIRSAKGKLI